MARKSTTKATTKKTRRDWKPVFLKLLAETANITASAKGADIDRAKVYKHRDEDESFAAAMRDALDQSCDALEAQARKRALESSDTLMIFLLKAHNPEKFRENHRHEFTSPKDAPVKVEQTHGLAEGMEEYLESFKQLAESICSHSSDGEVPGDDS